MNSGFNGGSIGAGGMISTLIGQGFTDYDEVSNDGTKLLDGSNSNGTGTIQDGVSGLISADFTASVKDGSIKSTEAFNAAQPADKTSMNNFRNALISGRFYIKDASGNYSKITADNIDSAKFDTAADVKNGNVFLARGTRGGIAGLEQTINEVVSQRKVVSASEALSLQLEFIKYSTQITAASQVTKTVGDSMNSTVRNIG